jgi:hypothetical protein
MGAKSKKQEQSIDGQKLAQKETKVPPALQESRFVSNEGREATLSHQLKLMPAPWSGGLLNNDGVS